MRSHSYVNTAWSILGTYDGSMPFAIWLKKFFRANKKFGSRDRKLIAHLCYSYYRLGNAFSLHTIEERILIGVFLTSTIPHAVLEELRPEWNEHISFSIEEKLHYLKAPDALDALFPFSFALAGPIGIKGFQRSFLIQPDLYLRIRPGKEEQVLEKLNRAGIAHIHHNDVLVFPNGTKTEEILCMDEEVVV